MSHNLSRHLSHSRNRVHRNRVSRGHSHRMTRHPESRKDLDALEVVGTNMSLVLDEIPLCKFCQLETVTLVTQRKPLATYPMPGWVKLLARLCLWTQQQIFFRYGWAASTDKTDLCRHCRQPKDDIHSIEYKGVYTNPAEGRWVANQPGGNPVEVPLNAEAPNETCTFRVNEYPAAPTEVRKRYQHQKLDLVAIPREHLMQLVAAAEYSPTNGNGHQ